MEHPSLRNINPLSPPLPAHPNGVQQQRPMPDTMQQQPQSPQSYQRTPQSTPSPELSPRLPVQSQQQQQPLRDALNSAFDSSPAAQQSHLDPELVRQVTEQVLKSLQTANISTLPISPTRATNFGSPATSDASLYTSSKDGRASLSSDASATARVRTNTGASQQTVRDPVDEGNGHPPEARGRPADARRQPSCPPDAKISPDTARQAARSVGVDEATTLEKIWTPLFDTAGNPTRRLSQFLRGLALHIIDDYEPRGSIVVTPAKMLRFFTETQVQGEHYPWTHVFGGVMSNASLSVMYRKLLCQHHLIQIQSHELPNVPALTPLGFEWFLTCLIQAHPDTEFDRLAKAVMNMPISNADNKSERFPKELSRRLLPLQPNIQAEQRLISSLNHEPDVVARLRNIHNMPPPPPQPPQQSSFTERERMPYAQPSSSVDTESSFSSRPIERERKPYTAKEGAGKVHGSDTSDRRESLVSTLDGTSTRPPRSHQPPPVSYMNGSMEPNGPPTPSRSRHRSSIGGSTSRPPLRNGRRSSPLRNPNTRSAPIDISDIPPSQYTSNIHPNDIDDDGRLRRWNSNRTTNPDYDMSASFDEADFTRGRSYPIPPRPPASVKAFEPAPGIDRRSGTWNEGFDGPQSYR